MSSAPALDKTAQLEAFGNVIPEGYEYYEKIITPGEDLSLPTAYLKWYDLYPADAKPTPTQTAESREFLASQIEKMNLKHELGFVIFHRAGNYLLLMLMTWRNTNEIWESAYAKDITRESGYMAIPGDGNHRGTYCVWELGAVWHERHAWVNFIKSERDEAAKWAYINDRFTGQL